MYHGGIANNIRYELSKLTNDFWHLYLWEDIIILYTSHYLEHTRPLFEKLNILSFKKLVIQRISLLMFKRHLKILPIPLDKLFILNNAQHSYNTRQHINIHTQIAKTERTYRLCSFHGTNIWNHI